jgi:hypothetical protein
MLGVARLNLAMSTRSLTALKCAAEAALNVSAAREAYKTRGRKAAMAKLTGVRTRVVDGNTEQGKVSVQRVVSLSPPGSRVAGAVVKKKRVQRSGRPTGWPKTKEERDQWNKRRAERAALGEPVGRAALFAAQEKKKKAAAAAAAAAAMTGSDGNVATYVPTAEQHAALLELKSSVAQEAGVDQSRVTDTVCRVSMSTADRPQAPAKGWWRPIRSGLQEQVRIIVSVEAQTPARRFRSTLNQAPNDETVGWPPLDAGASLWFPPNLSLWESPGEGDFVLEIETSIV